MDESFEKTKKELLLWQIVGPLSLLCAFILSARDPLPYDLYFVSLIGLFLSARYCFTGSFYALGLLIVSSSFQHALGDVNHLWRLGLEGAVACSFFITALSFEETSFKVDLLISQINAKQTALTHCEEDLTKTREEAAQKQMIVAQKLDTLQKDLEEISTEKEAYSVLNDVLRKTTAAHLHDKKLLEDHLLQDRRRLEQSQSTIDILQQEISQLQTSEHVKEKKALLDELNGIRAEKEQSHLINEKLVRLHAKESVQAQLAMEQLQLAIDSKRELQEQLKEAVLQAETAMLALKSAEKDQEKYQHALSQLERIQQEKLFLAERLNAADLELNFLKKSSNDSSFLQKERDQLAIQLNKAEEKIGFLSKLEPLHRQLRLQFEEKNKVLQETRAALFHVDTELQTLKIEREQQAHSLPEKITQEFLHLDEQILFLEKENEQLQTLVTHFISQLPQGQRKASLTKTLDEALFAAKQRRRGDVKKKADTRST